MQKVVSDERRLLKVVCTWERYDWDETLATGATPTEFDGFWLCEVPEIALCASVSAMSSDDRAIQEQVRTAIMSHALLDHGVGVSAVTALGLGDGEFDLDCEFVVMG